MASANQIRLWLSAIVWLVAHWLVNAKSSHRIITGNRTKEDGKMNHIVMNREAQIAQVVYTTSGNDNHKPCVFPFIFKGKTYTECTKDECIHNKLWCATTKNYDKDKKWGHCLTDDDVNSCKDSHASCGQWVLDGECVVNTLYMKTVCPRSCGLCTYGGNGRGNTCVFPFFFNNEVVFNCLPFKKKTWCAVTTNYNRDKMWGYCYPKMYRDLTEVNKRFLSWGECDDLHENCGDWAAQGECTSSIAYMDETCPWSCHKCAPSMLVKRKGCSDHSSMCKEWAGRGDCTSMPVFMSSFCRWECRLCAKPSRRISIKDRMSSCREWARNGDCETHQDFMLQNCRESCRAGGYVNGKACLDKVANCKGWATKGYCRDSTCKTVMSKNCRYSCGFCR